jgi:hypothetical protein
LTAFGAPGYVPAMSLEIRSKPIALASFVRAQPLAHSSVADVSLSFDRGSGGRRPGLYLTASVLAGHQLVVLDAKQDRARRVLNVAIEASGWSKPGPERLAQTISVPSPWPRRREQWTVVVKTADGTVLHTARFTFGGPPPGAFHGSGDTALARPPQ